MDWPLPRHRRWLSVSAAGISAAITLLVWWPHPLFIGGALVLTVVAGVFHERGVRRAFAHTNALLETKVVELEQRTVSITLLGEMSDRLQTAVHPADAYASIATFARELFAGATGALCSVSPSREFVEVVASWGKPATRSKFDFVECRALSSGRVPASSVGDARTVCTHLAHGSSVGTTCVPVNSAGETLGLLCIAMPLAHEPDLFRSGLVAAFVEQVGLALTNLRLKQTLRGQANHDELTGLYNRRFLNDGFDRELARAARLGNPVGVLMLDLDDFKVFNDVHGHAAGDALLKAFATRLRGQTRAADIACRYGGEEFALIMPDATMDQTLMRAEQIREATRTMAVEFDGSILSGVTTSIGVASCPQHGTSPNALLRAADAALYAAKAGGRNRVKVATPPAESARAGGV